MDKVFNYFIQMRWQDYLDMAVVAMLIYLLAMRIRGTRALQIMMGIVLLFALSLLTKWGGFYLTSWIFQYLWAAILLAIVILFQPEIRRILEEVSPLKMIGGRGHRASADTISAVVGAVFDMALKRVGAIIVFNRREPLDEFIQNGIRLDSIVSKSLILSIFSPPSPLHDGAVVIRGGRITRAGCFLPLAESADVPQYFGSRHRAALGITERTDAICLVVSEERGQVSLCRGDKVRACRDSKSTEENLVRLLQSRRRLKWSINWRGVFLKNLSFKAFSALLALLLWIAVSGVKTSEINLKAGIEYTGIPKKMSLESGGTGPVDVRVRGSRGLLAGISPNNVRVRLNLANAKEGDNFLAIAPTDLNLPPGVQITSINPSVIKFVLEKIEMRTYPVEAQTVDTLPSGLALDGVLVDPPEIRLEGPMSQLRKIKMVVTEPISLSGISSDKRMTRAVEIVPSGVLLSQNEIPKVTVTVKVRKTVARGGENP
jgi:uncharacterized protein (TIGR00159 family)